MTGFILPFSEMRSFLERQQTSCRMQRMVSPFFFFFAVVGLTKIRMFLSYLLSIISHHGEQEWGYPLPFLGKLCILTCWSSQGNETHYIYFLLCKSLTSSSYLQIVLSQLMLITWKKLCECWKQILDPVLLRAGWQICWGACNDNSIHISGALLQTSSSQDCRLRDCYHLECIWCIPGRHFQTYFCLKRNPGFFLLGLSTEWHEVQYMGDRETCFRNSLLFW